MWVGVIISADSVMAMPLCRHVYALPKPQIHVPGHLFGRDFRLTGKHTS